MASKKRKPASRLGILIAYFKKNPSILSSTLQLANSALLFYAYYANIVPLPHALFV